MKIPFLNNLEDDAVSAQICSHFTQICTTYPTVDKCKIPSYQPLHTDNIPSVTRMDVYHRLLQLKISKASPPEQLPKRLIKEFALEISVPLSHIYNKCLKFGIFPKI